MAYPPGRLADAYYASNDRWPCTRCIAQNAGELTVCLGCGLRRVEVPYPRYVACYGHDPAARDPGPDPVVIAVADAVDVASHGDTLVPYDATSVHSWPDSDPSEMPDEAASSAVRPGRVERNREPETTVSPRAPTEGEDGAAGLNDHGTGFGSPFAQAASSGEASDTQMGSQRLVFSLAGPEPVIHWRRDDDDPDAVTGYVERNPTESDPAYPWRIEDPDEPLRWLYYHEICCIIMTEAHEFRMAYPDSSDVERAMRAEIANGPYGRMLTRVRDYPFLVSDIRAAFHHGLQRENVVAIQCNQCRTAHGLEFWVCPMCYRRWNEYHDRPRWLTWKCPDCRKW